ncbi:hypothetical protein [Agrobacterium tumefaciens]|uniref:hypothetical protein n=1 Tax=Agrobacterium tumefaciens TaxID=358 RepID=UPI0013AF179F|nr:hypothetical protein [Agrobacterium tumefaciens]MEA1840711.1 hypothetical protein [Agrobacterium tumefaciens]
MARQANTVSVRTEAAAWNTLQAVLEKGISRRQGDLEVGDWAKFSAKFWIGDKEAVLTPPMMRALLDLQDAILRTKLLAIEQKSSLHNISQEERDAYEIQTYVYPGSTGLEIDLTEIAKHFVGEMVGILPPEYILIIALSALLLWAGTSAWRAWLEHRSKAATEATEAGKQRDLLEAQKFASQVDLDRWKLISQAQQKVPVIAEINDAVDKSRVSMMKAAARSDKAKIGGRIVPPEVADSIVKAAKAEDDEEEYVGTFKVLGVDSTPKYGFRFRLEDAESGEKYFASVRDALVKQDEMAILQEAVFEKDDNNQVTAHVKLTRRDYTVVKAEIVSVSKQSGFLF